MPLSRHTPFFLAALAGAAALAVAFWIPLTPTAVIAADTFFLTYLALTVTVLRRLSADFLRRNAAVVDQPVWAIFAATLGAVVVAVLSLFQLINGEPLANRLELFLAFIGVPLGWLTIHMMAAIHYSHLYWQPVDTDPGEGLRRGPPLKGLIFAGDEPPDGWDFVYFAFVLGMTAQTADVEISSGRMRRTVLVHSLVAFLFNTVLVAAAVNVAVSMG